MAASAWNENEYRIAGGTIRVRTLGAGTPLVIFHRDIGSPPELPFYNRLAERYQVVLPSLPGYDGTPVPDWARNVRDLVGMLQALFQELDLRGFAAIGLGYGGWITAELATLSPGTIGRWVLVGPMGLQPEPGTGEIFDQFLVSSTDYVRTMIHDPAAFRALFTDTPSLDQLEVWEINREMTTRVAWKPYMFNRALVPLLPHVQATTLIVHGEEDRIVPLNSSQQYARLLPHARLEMVAAAGHAVEIDQPERLAGLIHDFLG